MDESLPPLEERLAQIEKDYPIKTFTGLSCMVTSIRRMRAEREQQIPIRLRTGCPISVKFGKAVNELAEQEWEEFYAELCAQLRRDYPQFCKDDFP